MYSTGERSTNFLTAKEDPVEIIPIIEKVIENLPCSCSDLTRVWLVSWLLETNRYKIHKQMFCQEHRRLPAMVPTDAVCESDLQLCLLLHLVLQLLVQVDIPKRETNFAPGQLNR